MEYTNYPDGLSSFGIPIIGSGSIPVTNGVYWFVDPEGNDGATGMTMNAALATISEAVSRAVAGDVILVNPGDYDETVTVPHALEGITIVGLGNTVGVNIAPSTLTAVGLLCNAKNVTLINIDVAGEATAAYAAKVTGSGFRAYNCKFEGVTTSGSAFIAGPGTVAQVAALSAGHGGDYKFFNCEFAWSANGVNLTGTDYGAATQLYFNSGCLFHNLSASSFKETVGSGGASTLTFRNLTVDGCVFDNAEDGTVPTKFFALNGSNSNTGIVSGCRFPLATNATGKNLVSTKLLWVANYTVAGVTVAQPS